MLLAELFAESTHAHSLLRNEWGARRIRRGNWISCFGSRELDPLSGGAEPALSEAEWAFRPAFTPARTS